MWLLCLAHITWPTVPSNVGQAQQSMFRSRRGNVETMAEDYVWWLYSGFREPVAHMDVRNSWAWLHSVHCSVPDAQAELDSGMLGSWFVGTSDYT